MTNEVKMFSELKENKQTTKKTNKQTQKYCLRTSSLRVNMKCWLEVDVYTSTFSWHTT